MEIRVKGKKLNKGLKQYYKRLQSYDRKDIATTNQVQSCLVKMTPPVFIVLSCLHLLEQ